MPNKTNERKERERVVEKEKEREREREIEWGENAEEKTSQPNFPKLVIDISVIIAALSYSVLEGFFQAF